MPSHVDEQPLPPELETFENHRDVNVLNDKELQQVGRAVRDALNVPFGDMARMNVEAKRARIIELMPNVAERRAMIESALTTTQEPTPKAIDFNAPVLPKPAPQAKRDTTDAADALRVAIEAIMNGATPALDEDKVRTIAFDVANRETESLAARLNVELGRIVEEAMSRQAPRVLEVRTAGSSEGVKVDGAHPLMPKVLAIASQRVNVLLVGPAGCGKSFLAEQIAGALGRVFGTVSLTAGVTESALTGRLLPVRAGGSFAYLSSTFIEIYANGGVFLFDELDAADPNMLLVVNSALTNGHIFVEQRIAGDKDGNDLDQRIERHADCLLLGAANTYGTGATAQYAGRGALDAATLDRWYVVEMDYDKGFEARMFGGDAPRGIEPWAPQPFDAVREAADIRLLGEWVWDLRERSKSLTRVVSSRMIQKAIGARRAGCRVTEIKADLLAGWTADERRTVGVA